MINRCHDGIMRDILDQERVILFIERWHRIRSTVHLLGLPLSWGVPSKVGFHVVDWTYRRYCCSFYLSPLSSLSSLSLIVMDLVVSFHNVTLVHRSPFLLDILMNGSPAHGLGSAWDGLSTILSFSSSAPFQLLCIGYGVSFSITLSRREFFLMIVKTDLVMRMLLWPSPKTEDLSLMVR